jgi:heat shock protein HslJ
MHQPIKLGLLVALLLISTNLAGCAQGTDVTTEVPTNTPEPTPTEAPADLEGTLWKLDSYVNSQSESVDVLSNTEITIEFKLDKIGGNAGCNTYFASYEVEGNSLTIDQIGSTMMACEPEVNEQETQYFTALESVASYQVADDQLQMMNVDGETVLTFSVLEPTPLTGTTWRLTAYNDGKGGFVSVLSGTEITSVFGDDGSLVGSAGCNNYTASYGVEGENLSVGPAAVTRMMCAEPEGIMDQENAYLTVLESVATYQIKGNTLEAFDADGMRLASYTAETKAGMPNPASVYCEEQDGTVEIRTEEGGEVGYCVFPNGSECEEWALFRGECAPEGSSSLTPEALEDGVYQSEWPEDGVAQLTDGEYRKPVVEGSATELIIQLTDIALGDLDGDGIEDAAVILVTDPGGSGTFYDLAAVLNRNGKPEHVATASLGDRAKIRAFSIEAGQVIIEMVTHGPDDPMCCPTQIVRNSYALEGDTLVEMASEVIGSVEETSEAEIPAELLGTVWQWQEYVDIAGIGNITVDDPGKYTLEFLPDGNYRIIADCNRSSGRYLADGSTLVLEPGPTTLAECEPGSLYDDYLARLGDVVTYVLDGGRLVLNLKTDAGNMIFVPAEDVTSDADIVGVEWQWSLLVETEPAAQSVVPHPENYTLVFQPDGTLDIQADCNVVSGSYILEGNALTIKLGPSTMAYCGEQSSDQQYLDLLGRVSSYTIENERLVLNLKDGAGKMMFDRE